MEIKVQMPPVFRNTQEVYSYLFQMAQTINAANEAMARSTGEEIAEAVRRSGTEQSEGAGKQAAALRQLIVNTAQTVRHEMDALETELGSSLQAVSSRYGILEEDTRNRIEVTAQGILQIFSDDARIRQLEDSAAGLREYRTRTEGFIRSGFLGYDEDQAPILGIAVGRNLKSARTVTIDGTEYISTEGQSCAFYTSDRVSFLLNGREAASFSGQTLRCGDVEIGGKLMLSGRWELRSDGHLSIKWIGG